MFGDDPVCTWVLNSLLRVYLGYGYKLSHTGIGSVEVNGLLVLKFSGDLTYNYDFLVITVAPNGSYPQPEVYVSGPDRYSAACSTNNLEIESVVYDTSEVHSLKI